MPLRYENDPDVTEAVEEAARAACQALDGMFPGRDAGGITSNFQGLMETVLRRMLKGYSPFDTRRNPSTVLPVLVLGDESFGNPYAQGTQFVVLRDPELPHGLILTPASENAEVLDGGRFVPLTEAQDAYTSFRAAAEAAAEYVQQQDLTLTEFHNLSLEVRSVVPVEAADCGFQIGVGVGSSMTAAQERR